MAEVGVYILLIAKAKKEGAGLIRVKSSHSSVFCRKGLKLTKNL